MSMSDEYLHEFSNIDITQVQYFCNRYDLVSTTSYHLYISIKGTYSKRENIPYSSDFRLLLSYGRVLNFETTFSKLTSNKGVTIIPFINECNVKNFG